MREWLIILTIMMGICLIWLGVLSSKVAEIEQMLSPLSELAELIKVLLGG